MASSGAYAFSLENAEIIAEAFERMEIDPSTLQHRHLTSALRSLGLMFGEWSGEGVNQWRIDQETKTLTDGDYTFALPAGTIDVLGAWLRRSSVDTAMNMISRQDWHDIPTKTTEGRPDRFWVEKLTTLTPTFYHWPAAENSTDVIVYTRLLQMEDAGTLAQTPALPARWLEAICAGLAAKLAVKYAMKKLGALKPLADEAFMKARRGDRELGPTTIQVPRLGRRRF